jgi:DUF1680 family protein
VYAAGATEAVVNLFVAGSARFAFEDHTLQIEQRTSYPRTGAVQLRLTPAGEPAEVTLAIRIPAWSMPTATMNGEPVEVRTKQGYLKLTRSWSAGDQVDLDLGLTAHRTWAHPAVSSAAGKVALERGPIVFCLEGVDHEVALSRLALPRDADLDVRPDERTGLVTVHATGVAEAGNGGSAELYRDWPPPTRRTDLTAVPYFSWGNRGQSTMTVWVREAIEADPPAQPTKR